MLRITLNVFAPWVLWPLGRYDVRHDAEESASEKRPRTTEVFTVTVLFFALELVRVTYGPPRHT